MDVYYVRIGKIDIKWIYFAFGIIVYGIYATTMKNINVKYGYDLMAIETIYGGIIYYVCSFVTWINNKKKETLYIWMI